MGTSGVLVCATDVPMAGSWGKADGVVDVGGSHREVCLRSQRSPMLAGRSGLKQR
jgi:hypothetical protein